MAMLEPAHFSTPPPSQRQSLSHSKFTISTGLFGAVGTIISALIDQISVIGTAFQVFAAILALISLFHELLPAIRSSPLVRSTQVRLLAKMFACSVLAGVAVGGGILLINEVEPLPSVYSYSPNRSLPAGLTKISVDGKDISPYLTPKNVSSRPSIEGRSASTDEAIDFYIVQPPDITHWTADADADGDFSTSSPLDLASGTFALYVDGAFVGQFVVAE